MIYHSSEFGQYLIPKKKFNGHVVYTYHSFIYFTNEAVIIRVTHILVEVVLQVVYSVEYVTNVHYGGMVTQAGSSAHALFDSVHQLCSAGH